MPPPQSEELHRGDPAGPLRLRHRRERLGQDHAGARGAAAGARGQTADRLAEPESADRLQSRDSDESEDTSRSAVIDAALARGWKGRSRSAESCWWINRSWARRRARIPAVYIGAFDDIRELFAQSEPARQRGLNASAFSFNSAQGQCERCRGAGFEKIEMQFLSDVFIRCPDCNGRRYRRTSSKSRITSRDARRCRAPGDSAAWMRSPIAGGHRG